jgi:hypothetical protein
MMRLGELLAFTAAAQKPNLRMEARATALRIASRSGYAGRRAERSVSREMMPAL